MSSLESVDCIFQFFGEGPQFAVVEENTCNICIESSDLYCFILKMDVQYVGFGS